MLTRAETNLDVLANPSSQNISAKDGDVGGILALSSAAAAAPQKLAKKRTRQWAAWTCQEEERFFNALQEVGKNFEKITHQVQTKNKDQVRHYYYRLVRRMNKLLGPGFSLNAKNSKDTNAAMLHWWSLLEKYSCTASKLHLKPRRLKIFIETLAQQLLKDRNKTRRKHAFQGENCSSVSLTADSSLSKPLGNDVHTVKLVFVDAQSTQKLGYTKGRTRKHGVRATVTDNKEDLSSTMKTERQKRRTGGIASTAHKRWEKAAIDGVSFVADAAERLERTTNDRNGSLEKGTFDMLFQKNCIINGHMSNEFPGDFARHLPSAVSGGLCSQLEVGEANIQSFSKLKLQLFPIDEGTRKAMERDEHNPHLELTLSARKRISSIVDHLNQKWGKLSIASGELMLFPYGIQWNNIASSPRWTLKDTAASAGNVYASVGSPAVFRLSYGWFSSLEVQPRNVHLSSSAHHFYSCMQSKDSREENAHVGVSSEHAINIDTAVGPSPPIGQISDQLPAVGGVESTLRVVTTTISAQPSYMCGTASANGSMVSKSNLHTDASLGVREEIIDDMEHQDDMGNIRASDDAAMPAGDWADSLTNISIGDLLSETSRVPDSYHINPPAEGNAPSLQPISFTCDSFDAAIARFLSSNQDIAKSSCCSSPKSFLNAEETCDEFLFHKVSAANQENLNTSSNFSIGACGQLTPADPNVFQSSLMDFAAETKRVNNPPCKGDIEADFQFDQELMSDDKSDPGKNMALTDIYWPDSLGPLNLDISCTRNQGTGLLLSESISLSSLCSLIASSLDAFQNCSFFSPDKKGSPAGEVQNPSTHLENTVGSKG